MSKAIELAKECGVFIPVRLDGAATRLDSMPIETFFRRAQAMALREAAREFRKGDPAPKHWAVTSLERMADELEAGK